ncbi:MAG TPA: hypothetical protein VLF09_03230 [Cellvibrio sp.]|nr:hypothetical protein [Cellvibrio sp.]
MSLGTLTIDIAANLAGLESDLGKAQRVFDKNARDFEHTAKSIAKVTAGVAAAITVGFAAMVKSSIDAADQLTDVSEASGIAVEQLSALKLATDIEEISIEQLSGSLNKFNKSVVSAAEGVGTGKDAFDALGISVANTDGTLKNNYDLIEEVAEALSQLQDGAEKTALAQDLFGKSGAKLLPILNGGRQGLQDFSKEAERMGLIISSKTAEDAGRFNDNLTRLRLSLVGLSNVVAGKVTDDLAGFTSTLADPKVQEGLSVLAQGLSKILVLVGDITVATVKMYGAFTKDVSQIFNGVDTKNIDDVKESIFEVRALLKNPGLAVIFDPLAAVKYFGKSREELEKYLAQMLEAQKKIEQNAPNIANTNTKAGGANEGKVIIPEIDTSEIQSKIDAIQKEIDDSFRSQNESYARQIALAGEVTELERIRYETSVGSLRDLDQKQKIILENQAKEIDQIRIATKAEEDRKAIELKLNSDLESVRQSLLTQEEALTNEAERRAKVLSDAYAANKISEEEFGEAMRRNGEIANTELEALKKKNNEIAEITLELYRGVQNSIADAIVNGIKGGGENALEAFRDLLIRMAAEAAAANIAQWIFGGGQTGGGGSGQGANTVGWVNMAASLFGGGLAVGGPAYAGKMYEVGENNNPELFVANGRQFMIPGNGGSVVPAGGGGVVVNFDMRGASNSREMRESAGAIARKVSGAVAASQRYN